VRSEGIDHHVEKELGSCRGCHGSDNDSDSNGGLRRRYAATKSEADRKKILEKARRVSPTLSESEFLKPLESKAS